MELEELMSDSSATSSDFDEPEEFVVSCAAATAALKSGSYFGMYGGNATRSKGDGDGKPKPPLQGWGYGPSNRA